KRPNAAADGSKWVAYFGLGAPRFIAHSGPGAVTLKSTAIPCDRASATTRSSGAQAVAGYDAGSLALNPLGFTGGAIACHSTVMRTRSTPRDCSVVSVRATPAGGESTSRWSSWKIDSTGPCWCALLEEPSAITRITAITPATVSTAASTPAI